jgi:hypothetical protein
MEALDSDQQTKRHGKVLKNFCEGRSHEACLFDGCAFFAMNPVALAQSTVSVQASSNVTTSIVSRDDGGAVSGSSSATSNCSGAGCQTVDVTSSCNHGCTGSATVNGKTTTYIAPSGGLFTISVSRSGVVSSNGTVSNHH